MTRWIIRRSQDFTDVELLRISESIIAYAYLIISLQASARSHIVGNMEGALTAQKAILNNFENIMNHRVDIWEDIKCCQDTLSYAPSKVSYSVGPGIYMLSSDMNLNIRSRTAGCNNKILVANSGFSLGKNEMINKPEKSSNKTTIVHSPKKSNQMTPGGHSLKAVHTSVSTYDEERAALVLAKASEFEYGMLFVNEKY